MKLGGEIHCKKRSDLLFLSSYVLETFKKELYMTKEVVKHRKDEKKKASMSLKERRAKKQEKKQTKSGS